MCSLEGKRATALFGKHREHALSDSTRARAWIAAKSEMSASIRTASGSRVSRRRSRLARGAAPAGPIVSRTQFAVLGQLAKGATSAIFGSGLRDSSPSQGETTRMLISLSWPSLHVEILPRVQTILHLEANCRFQKINTTERTRIFRAKWLVGFFSDLVASALSSRGYISRQGLRIAVYTLRETNLITK